MLNSKKSYILAILASSASIHIVIINNNEANKLIIANSVFHL